MIHVIHSEESVVTIASSSNTYSITVIPLLDGNWSINPIVDDIKCHWNIWVIGNVPIAHLQWDPNDYVWKDPLQVNMNPLPLFQYSLKLGRDIIMRKCGTTVVVEYWATQGISKRFIMDFWHALWKNEQARKITTFQWLLVHRVVPVQE